MSIKGRQGFASMPTEAVRAIARKGGQTSHEDREGKPKAHEWTTEEARAAGRKGGLANGAYHRARRAAQFR